MLEIISSLFDLAYLSPHDLCLVWRPELIGLHVISDAVTGFAYYSIPLALVTFVRCRRDLAFGWMFGLFAVFILACGTTHFFSIWTLWQPDYDAQGVVKAETAMVSILTAIMLWPLLLPKAVALPSPTQLAILNVALQREIAERREVETRLRASGARYAGFFNNFAEGLFISAVNADGRLILEAINRNLATAGLDPMHSVGRLLDEVLPQAVAAKIEQRYRSGLGTVEAIEYEDNVELPTGVHTWHTVLVPLRGEDRRVVQPLNIIRLWIDEAAARLRESPLEPDHAAPIEQTFVLIAEQTVRMRSIIDHMRVFTRREGGRRRISRSSTASGPRSR